MKHFLLSKRLMLNPNISNRLIRCSIIGILYYYIPIYSREEKRSSRGWVAVSCVNYVNAIEIGPAAAHKTQKVILWKLLP